MSWESEGVGRSGRVGVSERPSGSCACKHVGEGVWTCGCAKPPSNCIVVWMCVCGNRLSVCSCGCAFSIGANVCWSVILLH